MATTKKTTTKAAVKKTTTKAAAKKTTTKAAAPKKAAVKKTTTKAAAPKKAAASVKKANSALDKLNKMEVTLTIEELNRMVEHRAYDLYMERGFSHGDDMHDWFVAEQEIRSKYDVK